VVILTGTEDRLAIGRAVQAGAQGFLRKTEAVADLAEAVRRAHRGEALNPTDEVEVALRRLRRRRDADGDMARRLERLTPREIEILQLMADGIPSDRIAADLELSKHTLRTHVQNILTKLGVHSKLDAIVVAIRFGAITTAEVVDLETIPDLDGGSQDEQGA
jgi:DNA-binding NarL/FixJ family response regulator